MPCCAQCEGIEKEFNAKVAARELAAYRRRGVGGTTKILIDLLRGHAVTGATLLDVGGGIGAIQHELAGAGPGEVTSVDASPAYLEAQRAEAVRRGYADRVTYLGGDFVAMADGVPARDIVTLDRVICCYPDMPALVRSSAMRARHLYGAVYPRATWWNAAGIRVANAVLRLRRSSFRVYLHAPERIDAMVASCGLRRAAVRDTVLWRIAVYTRDGETPAPPDQTNSASH